MKNNTPYIINSVSELHSYLNLKKPTHPLVSVIDLSMVSVTELQKSMGYNFYCVAIKKNFDGKIKYGQQYYDFDEGFMTFFAPKQVFIVEEESSKKIEGWFLAVHPDFIQGYPLAKKIKDYGYFSYATNEALHLSDREENVIVGIMQNLQFEIDSLTDNYTQDLVVSHIDLLLNYCNRFYNRQFITRKTASNEILVRLEQVLDEYLENDHTEKVGLPTVHDLAEKLNISPNYLSDMLRALTGQNTQQHIHNRLVEKAKELLSTTSLSVGEIAYQLGFEHPQSFNKLFKSKTNVSPLKFRQSFN